MGGGGSNDLASYGTTTEFRSTPRISDLTSRLYHNQNTSKKKKQWIELSRLGIERRSIHSTGREQPFRTRVWITTKRSRLGALELEGPSGIKQASLPGPKCRIPKYVISRTVTFHMCDWIPCFMRTQLLLGRYGAAQWLVLYTSSHLQASTYLNANECPQDYITPQWNM